MQTNSSHHSILKKQKAKKLGPGGLRCIFCTDFPPSKQKRVDRRRVRRQDNEKVRGFRE